MIRTFSFQITLIRLMSKIFRSGIFIFLLSYQSAIAQSITETQWYFGATNEALVFDKSSRDFNLVDDQATPFRSNGSAVITHLRKGNLLFYTDGDVIYDGSHQPVPGIVGNSLNADTTKIQPVVTCPVPGDTSRYYVFSNTGTEILYTILDASIVGNSSVGEFPLGDISGAIGQSTGLTNPGELMKIYENQGSSSFWLLSQDTSTYELIMTEVGAVGIVASTRYDVFSGGVPPFEITSAAFRRDSVAATLAIAPKSRNRNTHLLKINVTTGEITYNEPVRNTGFDDASATVIFDIEWSNDGTKLYISRQGDGVNNGDVYQIDFSDTVSVNPPVVPILNAPVFASYGLRMATDGNIYHLYQASSGGPFTLGSINRPDSSAAVGVLYTDQVYDTDFQGVQFPEFAPDNIFGGYFVMDFTYIDFCEGTPTKFFADVKPLPNNYFWDFGDGTFGEGPAPIHDYGGPFGGMVTLFVELDDDLQFINKPVDVLALDPLVDLGNDTTICVGDDLPLDAGDGVSYVWSTGETTKSINIDTAGTYWVEVTNAAGCTSSDDIIVTQYGVVRQVFNQWYFGDQAGLDFNFNPPAVLEDGMIFSDEGCATMSDANGQLLFYTNGSTVWNKEHNIMVGGMNIGGDSTAAQSSIILPFSGDATMFYIFTTEEVYGDFTFNMKMSVVDIKKDTARGEVVVKAIGLVECSTERVTASGFSGTPWLVSHEYGNKHYRAYGISSNGISNPVHSVAGEPHIFQNEPNATGYMKFAPGGNLVATVIPGSPNQIDLLDFDIITGAMSNSRVIDIEETNPAYGLEFSGDALKLYVTTTGIGSKLIQYDLDSLNSADPVADIMATKFDGYPTTLNNYGAIQRAPNGVVYIAIDGTNQVALLNSPSGDDATAGFQELGVDLLTGVSRLGLPNFSQVVSSSTQSPGMTYQAACAGLPTVFTGTGRDNSIETYEWDFGDTTGVATDQNPIHTYLRPGSYVVTLTLSNRCDPIDSIFTETVVVANLPNTPMVPSDTSLCGGPITLSAWNVDDPTLIYYWSSGDTTRSVVFASPTIVDVAIINIDGCSSDTLTVFIGQDEAFIDLGQDLLLCQNDTLVLDVNDPGPDYAWYRDGVLVGDQRLHTVNTSTAGTFYYIAEVTNGVTGCIYRDTIQIEVQEGPEAFQSNIIEPDCGEANGSFSLDIAATGSFIYSLSGAVGQGPFSFDGPGTTPAFTALPAGTYTSSVSNAVTGCVTNEIVQLEDDAPFDMEAIASNACARTGDIVVQFANRIPARVEINVINSQGTSVFSAIESIISSRYEISDLDTGMYYVQIRDLNPPNCLQTDTVQLNVSQECYRTLFVPNAFSPNGNGMNDEWFVFPNEFVDKFEVFILNRWGKVVFYSNKKDFRWSGELRGDEVLQGTYAYRILFTSTLEPGLGTIEQFGSVTVVK
ncbi:MAG: gliding motility-associated-like protein [Marinoscillum sp.]|jgi:gliding motility-associated-like protein